MSTRSSARRLLSPIEDPERLLSRRNRSEPSLLFNLEEDDMAGQVPPQGPIPDLRSMEELLQAPTDGVGDAIVVPPILTNQFELKIGLLNLVTAIAFHANVASASGSSTQDAHVIAFTKQVEALLSSFNCPVNSVQNGCETCGGPHAYYECQAAGGYTQEDVYATTDTYNQGGNSYQIQGTRIKIRIDITKGYNQTQAQSNVPPMEEMMHQLMRTTKARMQQMQDYNNQQLQKTQNTNMSNKMDQMQKVFMERPQGAFSSNIKPNPREQVNSIMTRSRLTTAEPSIPPPVHPTPRVKVENKPETLMDEMHITSPRCTIHVPPTRFPVSPPKTKEDPKPNSHQPKIPYPSRLNKTKQFLIPCEFYGLESCIALADLGDSINLMPLSMWKTLSLLELTPTRMTLELATWTVAYPAVDYDVDPRVPLILGRPFLRTAHTLVDVHGEELTLRVGDENLVFNVESTSKYPLKRGDESIHKIDIPLIYIEDNSA
ncbi:hypothetical protein Tco_0401584 [Tanacetum coccineum]